MSKSLFKNKHIIDNKIKYKSRNQKLYSFFLKRKLEIYSGRRFIFKFFKNPLVLNLKLGVFSLTRKIGKINDRKNKNKKDLKKK